MYKVLGRGGTLNISRPRWDRMIADHPGLDVAMELSKANAWAGRMPESRRWKTIAGFDAWLRRASERAENVSFRRIPTPEESKPEPTVYAPPPILDLQLLKNELHEEAEKKEFASVLTCEHDEVRSCHYTRAPICWTCGSYLELGVDIFERNWFRHWEQYLNTFSYGDKAHTG